MVIRPSELLHIVTRRNFDNDVRRHFVGRVLEAEGTLVRIEGYAFVHHSGENRFIKRPELRVRLFDLGESGHIVNVVPESAVLKDIDYATNEQKRLVVTDGKHFSLDVNEFGFSS